MKTATSVRRLLDEAHKQAFAHVRAEALRIMQTHRNLTHFCMAMGSASFHDANGPHMEPRHYTKSLHSFIDEFDRELRLTGTAIRMERMPNGSIDVRTDW